MKIIFEERLGVFDNFLGCVRGSELRRPLKQYKLVFRRIDDVSVLLLVRFAERDQLLAVAAEADQPLRFAVILARRSQPAPPEVCEHFRIGRVQLVVLVVARQVHFPAFAEQDLTLAALDRMHEVDQPVHVQGRVHSLVDDVEDREPHAFDHDLPLLQLAEQVIISLLSLDDRFSFKFLAGLIVSVVSYEIAGGVVPAVVAHDEQEGGFDAGNLQLGVIELDYLLIGLKDNVVSLLVYSTPRVGSWRAWVGLKQLQEGGAHFQVERLIICDKCLTNRLKNLSDFIDVALFVFIPLKLRDQPGFFLGDILHDFFERIDPSEVCAVVKRFHLVDQLFEYKVHRIHHLFNESVNIKPVWVFFVDEIVLIVGRIVDFDVQMNIALAAE